MKALLLSCALLLACTATASGQTMPDIRQMTGVPLPTNDLAAGSVSVRVIRGGFENNLANVDVVLDVDGREQTLKTDASGRAVLTGIPRGARVIARVEVDGERAVSQPFTMSASGVRLVLALGIDALAPGVVATVRPGSVTLRPDSFIEINFSGERLNVYYGLHISNATAEPIDPGGPIVIDLSSDALGTTIIEGSSPQATANGPRVTVTGPFAPGTTTVYFGYELRTNGDRARLEQRLPLDLPAFQVFAVQNGSLDISSPQLRGKQSSVQQGQALITARGSSLPRGELLAIDITGLPHHPTWPRNVALALAGLAIVLGIWTAFAPRARQTS